MFLPWLAKRKYLYLILLAVAAAVYLPFSRVEFLLWDDHLHLLENPLMRGDWLQDLRTIWTQPYKGLYIPLSYTLWRLWVLVFGLESPWPYLMLNLALHTLNGWLFYSVAGKIWPKLPSAVLLAASLIFLLHPLQAESVVWVSGLRDLSWVTFGLLAIWFQQRRSHGLMVLMVALALLCKPTAVVLPMLLWVLADRPVPWWTSAWMILMAAGTFLATRTLQPEHFTEAVLEPWDRFHVALDSLGFYLEKLLWPVHLSPDYGRRPLVVLAAGWSAQAWLGVTALLASGYLLWQNQDRKALLWIWLPLLPVLGLWTFQYQNYSTVADRYVYFSVAGFGLLFCSQLSRWKAQWSWPVLAIVILCGILSRRQAEVWRTNEGLFRYTLKANANSFMAENNLGVLAGNRGENGTALAHFEKSLALNPRYDQAVRNYGAMLVNTSRFDEAVEYYPYYLSLEPKWADLRFGYGRALLGVQRFSEALVELKTAMDLDPGNPAFVEEYAIALSLSGRTKESLPHFRRAVELVPGDTRFQFNLHHALEKAGSAE